MCSSCSTFCLYIYFVPNTQKKMPKNQQKRKHHVKRKICSSFASCFFVFLFLVSSRTGYPEVFAHFSHITSTMHEELRHKCEATPAPTASPTAAPSAHHCDGNSHYCWADAEGEASAMCTATAGNEYTCECPIGESETNTHRKTEPSGDTQKKMPRNVVSTLI